MTYDARAMPHGPSAQLNSATRRAATFAPTLGVAVGLIWLSTAWLFHNDHYTFDGVFASSLILVGAVSLYAWRPPADKEGLRFIGFVVFAQMFLNSGMSVLQHPGQLAFAPSPGAFSFAVEASLTLATVFTATVGLCLHVFRRPVRATAPHAVDNSVAIVLALGVAGSAIAGVLFASLMRLGTLPGLFFSMQLVVPLLMATRIICQKPLWLPLFICFAGQAVLLLYTSSIGTVSSIVQTTLLTYVYLHRRIPWLLVSGVVVLVLILNPAKHVFRETLAAEGGERTTSAASFGSGERALEVWTESLQRTWGSDADQVQVDANISQTSSRLDYNWVSALVYSAVPAALPYEAGATYADIPLLLIPRIIYPDKPLGIDYFKGRWVVKLGVQSSMSARTTAIAIPAAAEAYWNFGWPGVFFVPMILGVLFAGLLLLAPNEPVGRAAYTVLLSSISACLLDMTVWTITACAAFLFSAVLVRAYTRNIAGH